MKKTILFLTLICTSYLVFASVLTIETSINPVAQPSEENLPHTAILPNYISVGDTVQMGLAGLYEYCLALGGEEFDEDYYYQIDNNNNITIAVRAVIAEPCPGGGMITDLTHFYNLGELPIGDYHAQMWMQHFASPFPPDPDNFTGILGSNIAFTVHALPTPVPSTNNFILLILILILLSLAFLRFKLK